MSIKILDRGHLQSSLLSEDTQELFQLESSTDHQKPASDMSSPDRVAAEAKLSLLDTRLRDMCDDLDPDLITEESAPSMEKELDKIGVAKDGYRDAVRKFLSDYAGELSGPEAAQWKADMKSVVDIVKANKFSVLSSVNQVLPPVVPMTEFEKATINLQTQQLALQQQAIVSKKEEALATAKPLKKIG